MVRRFYGGDDPKEKEEHDKMIAEQEASDASWARSYQGPIYPPYDGVSY